MMRDSEGAGVEVGREGWGGLIIVFFIQSEPYIGITLERNERGRDETRHGRSEGKKGGTKRSGGRRERGGREQPSE